MKQLSVRLKTFGWWHEVTLFLLLVGLLVIAVTAIPNFLKFDSQLILSRRMWEMAIMALGMTLIIITGGIDLSIGSAMGLSAVTFGICFTASGSLPLSCLACLLTGTLGGALNGVLISKFDVHPLIVTLATYAAFRGVAEGVSQGTSYAQFGDQFSQIARGAWHGIPVSAMIFLVLAASFAVFLAKTPTGRFIYAIGHNEKAARFSGVRVNAIKFWLYTTSGLLAGLATIIYISRFDTAKADAGNGFELDVITAVLIGGTSIFGGRGNIVGTTLGVLLIHETRLFVSRYWRSDEFTVIVIGILLIASVLVYRALLFRRTD